MKRILSLPTVAIIGTLLISGCQSTQKMLEKVEQLEKRIVELEKKITAPPKPAIPPSQETAYNIPVGSSHVKGNKNASVSVVVFSDYQCPFCARVDPMLNDIIKDAELKDKVNLVFKHFPLSFHQNAKPASKAALAAGEQGKFWEMSEKLFANQQNLTTDNFNKWAKEINLDVKKFENDLKQNDAKYETIIKEDTELGIKNAQVRGTPSIYVGGWELRERSVEGVKNLIKSKNLMNNKVSG